METIPMAIRGSAADLGERFCSLEAVGLDPVRFRDLDGVYLTNELPQLVRKTANTALAAAAVTSDEVDLLLYIAALPESQMARPNGGKFLDRFSYIGTWLQHELGLPGARTIGVGQQGCSALFAALELAQAKLGSDQSIRHILCVGGDALPVDADRVIFHNAISDAAVALVVSRTKGRFQVLGLEQLSKAYFWDATTTETPLLATYFPSAKTVVDRLLTRLGISCRDIDAVIPTGIRRSSWPVLMELWGIPIERCLHPLKPFGHTIQADPILALQAADERGVLKPGMRLLLFTFGFGATWSAAVLEVFE